MHCPLCESGTRILHDAHPGYRKPAVFSIRYCANCDTQFVDPLRSDSGIYDIIYDNADNIRGYSRYAYIANTIANKEDPLGFLARSEDVYWFIENYMNKNKTPKDARILEVGSGLGYLTYAIHRRGYGNAKGIDISHEATESANQRFGLLFQNLSVEDLSSAENEKYDLIIMLEVLEHLENFFPVIESMKKILSPQGSILISTPNKSYHPEGSYWKTENPPVHLWWLSENSVRQIAIRSKLEVAFWDFSSFHAARSFAIGTADHSEIEPILPSYIDADGSIIPHPISRPTHGTLSRILERCLGEMGAWKLKRALQKPQYTFNFYRNQSRRIGARASTMGVVLRHQT